MVSTSVSLVEQLHPQAEAAQPLAAARRRSCWSTSGRRGSPRGDAGSREPDGPVAAVGGEAEAGVVAIRVEGVELVAGCSCGVSMPTSTAGPGRAASKAAARRASSAAGGLAHGASSPAGSHGAGAPSKASSAAVAPAMRVDRAQRVASVPPRRPRAACVEATAAARAGSSPGPGTGSLAHHDRAIGRHVASTALMSRTACSVPRTVPVTFERPVRGAYATSAADDPPARLPRRAAPSRPGSRCAGRRSADASRRFAPRDPERPDVAQVHAGAAAHPAGQLEVGQPRVQAARPRGRSARRRPTTRSAPCPQQRRRTRSASAGSSEASQSHTATNSAVAASQAGMAGGAVPALRAVDHESRRARRAISADPSVEPLSTTIARAPAGMRSSTHGSAAASSRHGSTMSTTASSYRHYAEIGMPLTPIRLTDQ